MAKYMLKLPSMGESVTEATITGWLKDVGDSIDIDEPLVEVATDKVDNELPSEVSGVLTKRLFEKDSVAQRLGHGGEQQCGMTTHQVPGI